MRKKIKNECAGQNLFCYFYYLAIPQFTTNCLLYTRVTKKNKKKKFLSRSFSRLYTGYIFSTIWPINLNKLKVCERSNNNKSEREEPNQRPK